MMPQKQCWRLCIGAVNIDDAKEVAKEEIKSLEIAVDSLTEKGIEAHMVATGSTPTAIFAAESEPFLFLS